MGTLGHLLLIAVAYAIVNNVVLSQFLGICPFLGVSKNTKTAAGMGGAVIFVITIATFVTQLIYNFILYPLTDYRVHSCNCSTCSVCRDVLKETDASSLQGTRCVSASYHNKLCRTRCST